MVDFHFCCGLVANVAKGYQIMHSFSLRHFKN